MRRAVLRVSLLALGLAACGRRERPAPAPAAPKPSVVYLGEWFNGTAGRCRVTHAERALVEAATLPFPGARVRPDVAVLDLALSCESALGAPAQSREVLPLDAFAMLHASASQQAGRPEQPAASYAPRARSTDDPRDHVAFELPEGMADIVMALRRYDARSGEASVTRERGVGTLQIRSPALAVDVLLRPRFHDGDLDALLDALAKGLARGADLSGLAAGPGGADAARALGELYTQVQTRFVAARLELSQAEARPTGVLAVLSLSRPHKGGAETHTGGEVARFELDLRPDEHGALRLFGFENREAARSALACGELEAGVLSQLARLPPARDGQSCNVLGMLLPSSCAQADGQLVERALSVRTRCRELNGLRAARAPALPSDFQLTLRRGRPEVGLDRQPRYSLTLFASGQVVFQGRHFTAGRERSDGRTARALLAGLYAQLRELDWFERRATPSSCVPNELGDTITLRAAGRERMALDRTGCRDPFSAAELDDLRRRVELVAGVEGFLAPAPSYADPQVEHWTLAESDSE
jgi:hypothetical protein